MDFNATLMIKLLLIVRYKFGYTVPSNLNIMPLLCIAHSIADVTFESRRHISNMARTLQSEVKIIQYVLETKDSNFQQNSLSVLRRKDPRFVLFFFIPPMKGSQKKYMKFDRTDLSASNGFVGVYTWFFQVKHLFNIFVSSKTTWPKQWLHEWRDNDSDLMRVIVTHA